MSVIFYIGSSKQRSYFRNSNSILYGSNLYCKGGTVMQYVVTASAKMVTEEE